MRTGIGKIGSSRVPERSGKRLHAQTNRLRKKPAKRAAKKRDRSSGNVTKEKTDIAREDGDEAQSRKNHDSLLEKRVARH